MNHNSNTLLIIVIVIAFLALSGNIGQFNMINNIKKDLQDKIDANNRLSKEIQLEKERHLKDVYLYEQQKKVLLDSLDEIKKEKIKIEKRLQDRILDIHSSNDSEYQEYLRSRVSTSH